MGARVTIAIQADNALGRRPRLVAIIADVLRGEAIRVTDDVPFAALGLDSLTAAEITTLIEDTLGWTLPATLLFDHPTLRELASFLDARTSDNGDIPNSSHLRLDTMRQDAILSPSIVPRGECRATGSVLLTGATGFVGAYLLRELLTTTPLHVVCLVRGTRGRGSVRDQLSRYQLWEECFASRVTIVTGDLASPALGLAPCAFAALADQIEAIYHGGASVDWVQPYEGLRDTNVRGTRELLRLACTGSPKRFVFLSSLAACYSTQGPRVVDESSATLPNLDGLHLGYAQSKCVAEALVCAAAARGLPATNVRPSLVSGDSHSGASNVEDLISLFFRGCVALGAAPDLDWTMDSVPVDYAGRAIVSLSQLRPEQSPSVYHLCNPRPRHWRVCVLWMRLRGYPMELIPYDDWANLVNERARTTSHPLHGLRSFFLHRVAAEDGIALPRLYEESQRPLASAAMSDRLLLARDVSCPPMDARLLGRYFDDSIARGALSRPPGDVANGGGSRTAKSTEQSRVDQLGRIRRIVETGLRDRPGEPSATVSGIEMERLAGDASIIAELTSWRRGTSAGLYRARVQITHGDQSATRDMMVKIKSRDRDVIEVGAHVAHLCGSALGDAYDRWQHHLGFTHGHLRELAIAEMREPAFLAHLPRLIATDRDDTRGAWTTVVEYVDDAVVKDADDRPWQDAEIDAALTGLARLHATWLGRTDELSNQPWLAPARASADFSAMTPLWGALADHAAAAFRTWGGDALAQTHRRLITTIPEWRPALDAQLHTLIHNDFNPRNIMLRGSRDTLALCAYDWELATIGAPQRDVVEFLCFTLDPATATTEAPAWLERARAQLSAASGADIPRDQWTAGARSALNEILIDRFAMYVMIDRFRPQRFLERVVRTWTALDRSM